MPQDLPDKDHNIKSMETLIESLNELDQEYEIAHRFRTVVLTNNLISFVLIAIAHSTWLKLSILGYQIGIVAYFWDTRKWAKWWIREGKEWVQAKIAKIRFRKGGT